MATYIKLTKLNLSSKNTYEPITYKEFADYVDAKKWLDANNFEFDMAYSGKDLKDIPLIFWNRNTHTQAIVFDG